MRKAIVVRKNKGRRICVTIISVVLIAFLSLICTQKDYANLTIVCMPIVLALLVLTVYYDTWKLTLSSDEVSKQGFFTTTFQLPYSQISDILASFSSTEYDHVRIVFLNGKQVVFRRDDDNAGKAVTVLSSHHSIRELKKSCNVS